MSARMRFTMLGLLALSAAPAAAWSQTKVDTTSRNRPAATKTAPPATKQAAPVTQQKTTTPPANPQQKTATAPANQQQKTVPQTKTPPATPPQAGRGAATPAAGQPAGGARGANAQVTPPRDTVIPTVMMREVYEYSREGRRDPFISLLTTTDLRPTLSDLKLLMTVVDEPGRSVALVSNGFDKKNPQRTLRVGDRLGRMRVSSIRSDVVVFTIEEFGMNRRDSLLLRDSTKARVGR
jgi:hypothetical protein